LFFLDEATALAAGHRPCFECRRGDAEAFARAWMRGAGRPNDGPRARVEEMDRALHTERLLPDGGKAMHSARWGDLPEGAMVLDEQRPLLKWAGRSWRWSTHGYAPAPSVDAATGVYVLTPRSTTEAIRAGYVPQVHTSAN
jgi:hypothetical protein